MPKSTDALNTNLFGDKKISKSEYAYEQIKEMIITGKLAPLSDVSETDLQNALGVSRSPIREAILRLEREAMLKIYPRKGTIVTDVTQDLIDEVYQVRLVLEPAIAGMAAGRIDRSWLYDMYDRFTNRPEALKDKKLMEYYIMLDNELHTKLMDCCPNRFLRSAVRMVHDQNRRIRYFHPNEDEQITLAAKEHIEIIQALLDNDPDHVSDAMRRHLVNSHERTKSRYWFFSGGTKKLRIQEEQMLLPDSVLFHFFSKILNCTCDVRRDFRTTPRRSRRSSRNRDSHGRTSGPPPSPAHR